MDNDPGFIYLFIYLQLYYIFILNTANMIFLLSMFAFFTVQISKHS